MFKVYRINGFTQQQGKNFQNLLHQHNYGKFQNYKLNTSHTDSISDGSTLKQYFGKQGMFSPTSCSSNSTVDDGT